MKFTQTKIQLRLQAPRVFCFRRAVRVSCALCVFCSLCALLATASRADEGMWLFNNPP